MSQLNLPSYNFRIKKQDDKYLIFDPQRKKFVALTPEEWVRQHFIRFLIEEKKFPAGLLSIEKQVVINGLKKRCDALLYSTDLHPLVLMEFKAPTVEISQDTFDQAAVYNSKLNVRYLIISNGLEHYFCEFDYQKSRFSFFDSIPEYHFFQISDIK